MTQTPVNKPQTLVNKQSPPASNQRKAEEREQPKRQEVQKWVELAQQGDAHAFRKLFDTYHKRVFAVAVSMVKNADEARDIVQEAFIKANKHLPNFQGTAHFYTWLYRITHNLCIDHLRKIKRRRPVDFDENAEPNESNVQGDGALLPSIQNSHPQKSVLRKELSGAIEKALTTLPEHHKTTLLLREVEGMNYEQIAEVMQVPKGTIMSRLFHARKKMQEELAEYLDGDLRISE